MTNFCKIEEIKKLFQKKLKDRQKTKGVSFSKIENRQKILKTHKKELSFKQKITDQAINNSLRQYSKLKKMIYLNEKKYDEIKKKDFEGKRIKELQVDLNYTNIVKLFGLVYNKNNPFEDSGKIVKKINKVDNPSRSIDKKRKKEILKNALHKRVKSKIDTGLKKELDFSEIFQKIENSKKNLEKMINDNNKKRKKLNKSKSLLLNYSILTKNKNVTNLSKSTHNKNLNEKISNADNSLVPSTSLLKTQNEISNEFKEDTDKSLESIKYENNIKINKFRKTSSSVININKINISLPQVKKPILLKKSETQKLKYFVINNEGDKLNFSQNKLKNKIWNSTNKIIMKDSNKKYIDDIEDIYSKFQKIKSESEKLKIDYKMRNISSFEKIDEMINIKEKMKIDLLKDKYLKICFSKPKFKKDFNKKSKLKAIINSIK